MIKIMDDELFSVFYEWCEKRFFPIMARSLFPSRAYMAFIGEKPIVTAFIYKDETSAFTMLEWIVANPDSTSEEREIGIADVISHVREEVKKIGGTVIFTTAQHPDLEDKLLKNGFLASDQGVNHFIGGI